MMKGGCLIRPDPSFAVALRNTYYNELVNMKLALCAYYSFLMSYFDKMFRTQNDCSFRVAISALC